MFPSIVDYCYALDLIPMYSVSPLCVKSESPNTQIKLFRDNIISLTNTVFTILSPNSTDDILNHLQVLDKYINIYTKDIVVPMIQREQNKIIHSLKIDSLQADVFKMMHMRAATGFSNIQLVKLLLSHEQMRNNVIQESNIKQEHQVYAAMAFANLGFVYQCFNAPFYLENPYHYHMPNNKQELRKLVIEIERYYLVQDNLYQLEKESGSLLDSDDPKVYMLDNLPSFWQKARLEHASYYLTEATRALNMSFNRNSQPQIPKEYFIDIGSQGGKAKSESEPEKQRKEALKVAVDLAIAEGPYANLKNAAYTIAGHAKINKLCETIGALRNINNRADKIYRHFLRLSPEIKSEIKIVKELSEK